MKELPQGVQQQLVSTKGAPEICVRCGTSCECPTRGGRLNRAHFASAGARCNYGELAGGWANGHWRPAPGTCPSSDVGAGLVAARSGNRSFHFLGNSVTRHYAMALAALLSRKHDEVWTTKRKRWFAMSS